MHRWAYTIAIAAILSNPLTFRGADFDKSIAPLFVERCLDCHSGKKPKGGLDLSREAAAMTGGDEGRVIVPGKPEESLLWEYVRDGKMPPKKPLSAEEKAAVREWISSGAAWGADPIDAFRHTTSRRAGYDWWALQPLRKVAPPQSANVAWCRNPIDAFILQGQAAAGLSPSSPAERRVLIRRLSFDLLGLPPTPEEVERFLADTAPDAYEKLVERCLASPEHGVRWARHWLDVVRFGESNGFEHDEFRPTAWPYRDWVVNAFNADMPYDEFARLQLAGDILRPYDPEALKATGFLVAGAYDSVGQSQQSAVMRRVVREDELEDIVGTVSQAFLGLTSHCARCHDHKFDPIKQEEYYRLTAALNGVRHGERALFPSPFPPVRAYATVPRQAEVGRVLIRGNPAQPGDIVSAGGIRSLVGVNHDFGVPPEATDAQRRRRLAEWIAHPDNPLFARVIVNRLWQHHFGAGLVETPNDFGFNGGRPSHPELLDWLARELARSGWRLKHIHRLIVTSATYRQSSRSNPTASAVDAGNRLLWRKSPERLEAEQVRDSMLFVAGQLSCRHGGPGFADTKPVRSPGTTSIIYQPVEPVGEEFRRRTLYRVWSRGGRNRLLDTLDCPDPSTTAPRRAVTTTPLQALAMLNNKVVLRLAEDFARRIERDAGPNVADQVRRAYLLAYGRPAKAAEIAEAAPIVREHGLFVLARTMFNSNEFLYVD